MTKENFNKIYNKYRMDGRVYRYGIKSDLFIPPEVTVDTAYFYLDRFERDGDTHRMNKLLEELDSIKEL